MIPKISRIAIDITESQRVSMQNMIPHGAKNRIFSHFIDELVIKLQDYGELYIAAYLEGYVGLGFDRLSEYAEKLQRATAKE